MGQKIYFIFISLVYFISLYQHFLHLSNNTIFLKNIHIYHLLIKDHKLIHFAVDNK